MDGSHFDRLVSRLTETASRRRALGVLGVSALLAGGLSASDETEARRRRRKHRKGGKGNTTPPPTPNKQVRQACVPGADLCASPATCGTPTEQHQCDSTIDEWIGDAANLCCVPQGGPCSACECCGDTYCQLGMGNTGTCQPL